MQKISGHILGVVVSACSIMTLAVSVSHAQASSADAFSACLTISKDRDRLKCYDAAAELLQSAKRIETAKTRASSTAQSDPSHVTAGIAPDNDVSSPTRDTNPSVIKPSALSPKAQHAAEAKSAADEFGKERLEAPRSERKELRALAISVSRNRRGKYVIVLEDGQVWRQINADSNALPLSAEEGSEVIIKRKSLGSYGLRVPTSKRTIIVKRIK